MRFKVSCPLIIRHYHNCCNISIKIMLIIMEHIMALLHNYNYVLYVPYNIIAMRYFLMFTDSLLFYFYISAGLQTSISHHEYFYYYCCVSYTLKSPRPSEPQKRQWTSLSWHTHLWAAHIDIIKWDHYRYCTEHKTIIILLLLFDSIRLFIAYASKPENDAHQSAVALPAIRK